MDIVLQTENCFLDALDVLDVRENPTASGLLGKNCRVRDDFQRNTVDEIISNWVKPNR